MHLLSVFIFVVWLVSAQDDSEDNTASMSTFIAPNSSIKNAFQSTLADNIGFVFGIPCSNRTDWDIRKLSLGSKVTRFINQGASFLGKPQPAWSDDAYLNFYTKADRKSGQDMMLSRTDRLLPLALAECFYWNGTFADQLNQELLSVLNQPTWVWAAHDPNQDSFSGREHFVELSSSFHSGIISVVVGLLDTKISPYVRSLVNQRLSERITQPVLKAISSLSNKGPFTPKNYWMTANLNWNAICWGGAVIAASISLSDKSQRATLYSTAFLNGNNYLNVFTSDGWDTEGVQYWNLGYGEFVVLREALLRVTKNKYDVLNDPLARTSSRFAYEAALFKKEWAWVGPTFGDSPDEKSVINSNLREYLEYALGTDQQLGQIIDQPTDRPPGVVIGIFSDINPVTVLPSSPSDSVYTTNSLRSFFSKPGILIARPNTNASPAGITAAFKLLGNQGVHSHNDVGTYEIYFNGYKITGEPGGVYYTGNSFGANRFKSELMNSIGHPVPKVNGQEQILVANGSVNILNNAKVPFVESTSFTNDIDTIVYDLTGAYAVPSLTSLKRIIKFSRKAGNEYVSIEDKFNFSSPSTFETAVIAPFGWDFNAKLFWNTAAPNSQLLLSTFSSSNTRFTLSASTISSTEYNKTLQRISLATTGTLVSGSIGYTFTPQYKCASSQFLDSTTNTCQTCTNGVASIDGTKCSCNAGYYWDSTQKICIQCDENKFSVAGSSSCGSCLAGSKSPAGSSYCIAPAGKYWDTVRNGVYVCPDSTYSPAGSFECTACPTGATKQPNIPWNPLRCFCGAGYYWNSTQGSCVQCDQNQFSVGGTSSCGYVSIIHLET